MAEFNPIGDVGYTLVSLLRDEMGELEVSDQQIALVSPAQYDANGSGLSLYLYHIDRYAHLSNDRRPAVDSPQDGKSPLVLELYYLLTAHPAESDSPSTSTTMAQHRMLSEAVRILDEHTLVGDPDLKGSLADGNRLQISISRQSPEHILDLWNAFPDTAHLPSVSYVVTPVTIETEPDAVAERLTEVRIEQYADSETTDTRSNR